MAGSSSGATDPARPIRAVAILGPTAAGKSALGLDLARSLGGEILCCDSVQVYRGLDIGSAKPTPSEQTEVPHHLLDLVSPHEPFHAARWAALAVPVLESVAGRGHVPVVVGGTGLYFRALSRGLFDAPPPDPLIRARLEEEARVSGVAALHDRLATVDPVSAARIRRADLLRIGRALEIFEQTGVPLSTLQRQTLPPVKLDVFTVVLEPPQLELRARVAARVELMMEAGFLEEVRALRQAGFGASRALQSLGYRQIGLHLDGAVSLTEAVTQMKLATAAYARRQRTWFNKEEAALRLGKVYRAADFPRLLASVAAWADLR